MPVSAQTCDVAPRDSAQDLKVAHTGFQDLMG